MEHSPSQPDWPDRDRFVLSCGHASMLLYSTLYLTGYGLTLDDLKNFRQLGSPTAGHPEYGHAAGIETTTGPLGQGISTAVGMALAERMLAARFNRDGHEIVDHYTYVIASDGDLQEGIASEASSLAGHLGLGRLIASRTTTTSRSRATPRSRSPRTSPRATRPTAGTSRTSARTSGSTASRRARRRARRSTDRPTLIVVRTHIAPGSPNKQDTHGAHGAPLGDEEIRLTKEVYGWPSQEPFFVPDEALEHFRECVAARRGARVARGSERSRPTAPTSPPRRRSSSASLARELPDGWDADVPKKGPDAGMIATRKASQDVIQWAAAQVPELVGGSADLAPSTLTLINGGGDVEHGAYAGRNFHFGIREHGMGAIVNGLVLHGLRAFGAGFFIFSDYMKASIRLAAIMRIPSTFVFTHDSIGVGEDGPTHQPIEQLATLRATPNINVVRPAGFNETALAWRFALHATETPTALALSRQGVPVWDPAGVPGRRDRARRLRAEGHRRRAGPDPDGVGHRGPHRPRRR